jgi:Fic family protein
MKDYSPPITLDEAILGFVAAIGEAVGRLSVLEDFERSLKLRRVNRVRTIHGSLSIEGNTLSEEQITAILQGKRVIAPPKEILEVKNALAVYDRFPEWNPSQESDLLEAHRILMTGLIDQPGDYRSGGVGVMAGETVVHMAPPASRVPELMVDLLGWLSTTGMHPLVSSSVFHYEFEFIHPFSDGNGRMGRLWQSLILAKWKPIFAYLPVESLIFERQQEYYQAIQESTRRSNSAPFVRFMLQAILDTVQVTAPQVARQVTPQVAKLLKLLTKEMGRVELQGVLGLRDRKSFIERYLHPAIKAGLVEMTRPEEPNSRFQKYRLTEKGKRRNRGE